MGNALINSAEARALEMPVLPDGLQCGLDALREITLLDSREFKSSEVTMKLRGERKIERCSRRFVTAS